MTSRANRKRIQPTLDQVMSNIDSVPLASKIRASFNRVYDPNEQRYSFNNVSFWTKSLLEYFISRPDLDIGHLQQQYGIGRRSPVGDPIFITIPSSLWETDRSQWQSFAEFLLSNSVEITGVHQTVEDIVTRTDRLRMELEKGESVTPTSLDPLSQKQQDSPGNSEGTSQDNGDTAMSSPGQHLVTPTTSTTSPTSPVAEEPGPISHVDGFDEYEPMGNDYLEEDDSHVGEENLSALDPVAVQGTEPFGTELKSSDQGLTEQSPALQSTTKPSGSPSMTRERSPAQPDHIAPLTSSIVLPAIICKRCRQSNIPCIRISPNASCKACSAAKQSCIRDIDLKVEKFEDGVNNLKEAISTAEEEGMEDLAASLKDMLVKFRNYRRANYKHLY